jgi:hypothetical protein
MMASIPNMRGNPLPAPTPRTAATEAAPGEFAKKMPMAKAQGPGPVAPAAPVDAQTPVEDILPVSPDAEGEAAAKPGDEGDDGAGTKAGATPQTADILSFTQLPTDAQAPILVSVPQSQPPVVPVEVTPEQAARPIPEPVTAGRTGRRACGTGDAGGDGKTGLSLPGFDVPKDEQTPTREIEAAVKLLLQRKQVLAKPAASADAAKADAAKVDIAPAQASAASPAANHAATPMPNIDLPQPVLAALDTQPAPLKAAGNVDAPRSTELPTERQLDISRDTAWLDRLARDIASAGANDAPLRFRLHPQTLGHLQVELQQGDHGTSVRLTVETEAARNILTDAQPRLAAEARAQGVRIAETHVDLGGSGREATGDRRRQDETRQNPLIRTVHGTGADGIPAARSSDRTRLDRYA